MPKRLRRFFCVRQRVSASAAVVVDDESAGKPAIDTIGKQVKRWRLEPLNADNAPRHDGVADTRRT
ncbi:hypothetical protein [Burkholderia multivorans]|uniref:hypothetical protein n=1 Tax=Burkholderia multivorans TaxID=87883 RepID=UPI0011B28B64|nr:hypothetical protein [Burkholderia multivorans]